MLYPEFNVNFNFKKIYIIYILILLKICAQILKASNYQIKPIQPVRYMNLRKQVE